MARWLVSVLAILLGVLAFFYFRPNPEDDVTGDPEAKIIAYLRENVSPGKPVYVTELYNTVFSTPQEREVLERLHKDFFNIPATAAKIYMQTGKIPTLQELSDQFQYKVPGEMDVLLRVMESDPRVPKFFERDPSTGEITSIDIDRIAASDQFGQSLRN
jgi:hypothetical protein